MKLIKLSLDGSVELISCKRKFDRPYYKEMIADCLKDTIFEDLKIVYDDVKYGKGYEDLYNKNAELISPFSLSKFDCHVFVGNCYLIKTKPFQYKNGLVGTREISCTKDDFEIVKNFLNIKD